MQATLLSILGLALLGTLHAQDSIPVQTDFQQDKVTRPTGIPSLEVWGVWGILAPKM